MFKAPKDHIRTRDQIINIVKKNFIFFDKLIYHIRKDKKIWRINCFRIANRQTNEARFIQKVKESQLKAFCCVLF